MQLFATCALTTRSSHDSAIAVPKSTPLPAPSAFAEGLLSVLTSCCDRSTRALAGRSGIPGTASARWLLAVAIIAIVAVVAVVPARAQTYYFGGTNAVTTDESAATIANGYLGGGKAVQYPATLLFGPSVLVGGKAGYAVVMAPTDEKTVVAGTSQGALVVNDVERRVLALPADQRPAKDELSFVQISNPAGHNGLTTILPITRLVIPTGQPVADSPYDHVEIDNQYDGFSDFPDHPENLLASANALIGVAYLHPIGGEGFDPNTAIKTEYTNSAGGTVTRYVIPTNYLPLTRPLRDLGVNAELVDGLDARLRPIIDSAYERNTTQNVTRPNSLNRKVSTHNGLLRSAKLSGKHPRSTAGHTPHHRGVENS